MFDDLLLLAEGRVIYQGEGSGAIPYFSKLGFKCPNFVNPADFLFMAILNNEEEDQAQASHSQTAFQDAPQEDNKERINRLLLKWTSSDEGLHDAQSNISRQANL
jgi:ABC-type multidrug transport system ATPase subunit